MGDIEAEVVELWLERNLYAVDYEYTHYPPARSMQDISLTVIEGKT
jgi:hypothetical protein